MKRRDFVKTMAISGMAVAASDSIGDLIAQTPQGKVLESKFKGLADIALAEAKGAGCTYADIRFTRSTNNGVNASGGNRDFEDSAGSAAAAAVAAVAADAGAVAAVSAASADSVAAAGARRSWRGRIRHPRDSQRRVGLREQPDRHRGRDPAHRPHGNRGRQGKRDRQEAPTSSWRRSRPTPSTGQRRSRRIPRRCHRKRNRPTCRRSSNRVVKSKEVTNVNASVQLEHEWKYFASSGRVVHRTGDRGRPRRSSRSPRARTARRAARTFTGVPMTGGWEVAEAVGDGRERRAHRRRSGRVLHREADRHGGQGPRADAVARDADDPRDRRARDRARSHPRLRGELRRHELREDLGHRQAEIRLEALQRHRRPDDPGRRRDGRLRR